MAIRNENRRQHSEQIKRGQLLRIQQGVWPGRAPLGYRNERQGGRARITIDPLVAPLVRQCFSLAAEGTCSLQNLVEIMAAQELRSTKGTPLSASVLYNLLTNPFYIGQMRFEGRVVPGAHEPLIDRATFEAVQRRLAKPNKN